MDLNRSTCSLDKSRIISRWREMRQTRAVTSADRQRNISTSLQSTHAYRGMHLKQNYVKEDITHIRICFSDKIRMQVESDWSRSVVASSVWLFLKISICIMNTLIIDTICISSAGRNTLDKLYSVGRLRHLSLSVFVIASNVISPYVATVVNLCKRSDLSRCRNPTADEGTISCSMGCKNPRN